MNNQCEQINLPISSGNADILLLSIKNILSDFNRVISHGKTSIWFPRRVSTFKAPSRCLSLASLFAALSEVCMLACHAKESLCNGFRQHPPWGLSGISKQEI